ncbi:transposase [Candidatus Chlorohelix allophototropha]|uniref:integrase core domain-containing protein n=1 Tax=Candidatus Chlorohelix allophototropha TaxID=3003348 RepID=UPI00311AB57D
MCPPHRPDMNGFVERYNGSFGRECLAALQPQTLAQVREVTAQYRQHYNYERPHQGLSCGNKPPRVAFAELPVLKSLPLIVNPDGWIKSCHGLRYLRKADHKGTVRVDKHHYYVGKELAGKYVQAEVDGVQGQLVFWNEQREVKRVAIKGLIGQELGYEEFLKLRLKEAKSERRLAGMRTRARQGIAFDS